LFDLLLHILDLFKDKSHGACRLLGFQRLFIIRDIDTGGAGARDRDLCFREIYFKQGVDGDIKIIANYEQFVQTGFTDPVLPISNGRLTFLNEGCNLRLGSGGLLPEMPEIFS
jgi:hypothetical protein